METKTTEELMELMLSIHNELNKRNNITKPSSNKYRLIKEVITPLPYKLWYVPNNLSDDINDYVIDKPFAQKEVLLCGETTCRRSFQPDHIGVDRTSILKWATYEDVGEDVDTHIKHYVDDQKRKSRKHYSKNVKNDGLRMI